MTSRLEDDLREVFAAKTRETPAPHDTMTAVLTGARRVRRRRRATAVASVAVLVVVALFSVNLTTHQSAPPAETPKPERLRDSVELVVNGTLLTPDGHRTRLAADEVTYAVRVPAGLVYRPAHGTPRLWLLGHDGTNVSLGPADLPVFSRDGRRMASCGARRVSAPRR